MPPQRITRELLLRRAEHNDRELSTLQEITLHQFDLEKIELLDVYCRELRIVFLQNNQIQKIGASCAGLVDDGRNTDRVTTSRGAGQAQAPRVPQPRAQQHHQDRGPEIGRAHV